MQFPLPAEPSILQQHMKARGDDTTTTPAQINHWSHKDHPLVLLNEADIESSTYKELLSDNDDKFVCDGCLQSMRTGPFYGCIECKFFLHQYCVKLPSQLPHPFHDNRKLVCGKYTQSNLYIKCFECKHSTNGMFYSCSRAELFLDVNCALLPKTIKHKSHNSPLCRTNFCHGSCNGCEFRGRMLFKCTRCNFVLCKSCTFMPSTVRHRWDPHPIRLVYSRIEDHPDEFYCEICEEDINTNLWLYFCRDCDLSFHPKCLYPYYAFANIKFGANNIKVDNHPHHLTFTGMKWHKFGDICCGNCKKDIPDGSPILECESCVFRLCGNCIPSKQGNYLVEACERPKEEESKLYSILSAVLSSNNTIFVFCVAFIMWVLYRLLVFLWMRLYIIPCILFVIWLRLSE